jgi:hypothetical protein
VTFLPGVPKEHVLHRLRQAGGSTISRDILDHPESSAALSANAFGWFIPRPRLLPVLPGAEAAGAATRVEVAYCARDPRNGPGHPWLPAIIMTRSHLIGVVSKRCEPFRDAPSPPLRDTGQPPVRGSTMEKWRASRQDLMDAGIVYQHLDAAGLVVHAYGLHSEARRLRKTALLHYIFAEPSSQGARPIAAADHWQHRAEIADFAVRVGGDDVGFSACSYREWLETCEGAARGHALNVATTFAP